MSQIYQWRALLIPLVCSLTVSVFTNSHNFLREKAWFLNKLYQSQEVVNSCCFLLQGSKFEVWYYFDRCCYHCYIVIICRTVIWINCFFVILYIISVASVSKVFLLFLIRLVEEFLTLDFFQSTMAIRFCSHIDCVSYRQLGLINDDLTSNFDQIDKNCWSWRNCSVVFISVYFIVFHSKIVCLFPPLR